MNPGGNGTAERQISAKNADYLPSNLLCIKISGLRSTGTPIV